VKRRRGSQPDNQNASTPHPSVDAYFDRELTPDSIESLLGSLDRSPGQRQQFDDTQSLLDDLRTPMAAPDVSGRILGEVGDRRGWLSTGQRRLVSGGRLATAACLLLVVTGLLVVRRNNPEVFRAADNTGPVSEIVDAGGSEAGAGFRAIGEGLRSIEIRCQSTVAMAADSASSCQSRCGMSRMAAAANQQDFSMPISPGVGQWLGAGNVKVVFAVSIGGALPSGAPMGRDDASINCWMIDPDRNKRLPSYEATSASGPRLIDVADWTAIGDRVR